jgi:hypothetical protein
MGKVDGGPLSFNNLLNLTALGSLPFISDSLDVAVDNIDFTLISYAVYALIGISVIVALLFRYLAYRRRQAIKPVHDYHCISAYMAWEGGDNTIDNKSADSVTKP